MDGLTLIATIIAFWLLFVIHRRKSMKYRPITTDAEDEPDIFKNQANMTCVPGPSSTSAYYTDTTGGGLCGDQQYVHRLGYGYNITDGVGGTLLSM